MSDTPFYPFHEQLVQRNVAYTVHFSDETARMHNTSDDTAQHVGSTNLTGQSSVVGGLGLLLHAILGGLGKLHCGRHIVQQS